jgi:rod shape determining protein RodA
MEAPRTHLNFLPAHHTDFIFAVIGEELGFVGAMLLLGLFGVIIWRGVSVSPGSPGIFYGSLVASGVAEC